MKNASTLLLLIFWLTWGLALAQPKPSRVYLARVGQREPPKGSLIKRRNDQILFQAKNQIDNLRGLLNTLTFESTTEPESNSLILNSYLPNPNQIFYNDGVVVEDDIDPNHTSSENVTDLPIERYLQNMALFYTKTDGESINFSHIITSPIQEGKEYPYVKVFFTQTFVSKHNQINIPYRPVERVAELRAEIVDNKWRVFITRLAFLQPGEGLTELTKPVIANDFGPKQPLIKGKLIRFKGVDNPSDSLSVKWDKQWLNINQSSAEIVPIGFYQRGSNIGQSANTVRISLAQADQQLTIWRIDGTTISYTRVEDPGYWMKLRQQYRRLGWTQVITGIVAVSLSYATYQSFHNDYTQYVSRVATLNDEYAIWQTLTQQSGGTPINAVSFSSYANPGIYGVYGGGVVGTGLLFNGIRQLLKARKVKKQHLMTNHE